MLLSRSVVATWSVIMLCFAVMKAFLLALCLVGCGADIDANVQPAGGPARYSITECGTGECYRAAAAVCPYGYDQVSSASQVTGVTATPATMFTAPGVSVHRERELMVQCKLPVYCDHGEACAFGFRCFASKRYPGHNVCAS